MNEGKAAKRNKIKLKKYLKELEVTFMGSIVKILICDEKLGFEANFVIV